MQPADLSRYLGQLRDYYRAESIIPSTTQLGALWGVEARSWAHRIAVRLKEERFLEDAPGNRLRPGPRFFERPLAGRVRAGLPEAAADAPADVVTIDSYLIDKPSDTVVFKVKGDSMIDAAIQDGDFVVIERRTTARIGEIVLAMVDDEFTLKYLAQDAAGYYLEAANAAYGPIRPARALEIYGVYIGLFRKAGRPRA